MLPVALGTALRIALRRMRAEWRLMAAVTLGVVLAVALTSSTAIYRDALRTAGLRSDFQGAVPTDVDVRVVQPSAFLAAEFSEPLLGAYSRRIDSVDRYFGDRIGVLTSSTFFLTAPDAPQPLVDPRIRVQFMARDDFADHVTLGAGELPAPATGEGAVGVALGAEAAASLGLDVGDRVALHTSWSEEDGPLLAQVTALVEPDDPLERYWGAALPFTAPQQQLDVVYAFVPRETLTRGIPAGLPGLRGRLTLIALTDQGAFTAEEAEAAAAALQATFRTIAREADLTRVETDLVDLLERFTTKQFFSAVPLLVLTLQIVAIVLFYIVLVAGLVIDRQRSEVALLKGRGAGLPQVMTIAVVEGLVLAGIGMALGPLLARQGVALLGFTPAFSDITDSSALTVRLTGTAYLWAGLGAALAFAALLWPAYRKHGQGVMEQRHASSRPQVQPAFQRYYMDLVLVAIAALLFFQLADSGSLLTEDLFGGLEYDPLLLAAPVVFVLTVSVLFLRLFPLLLHGAAKVAGAAGAAVQLALWHLVRAPLQPGRLALLLIMATSLGMFGGTFGATLERSFDDRAHYEAGAAMRLSGIRAGSGGAAALRTELQELTGPDDATIVIRASGTHVRGPLDISSADILGVDPREFSEVAWFREDFAPRSLSELMNTIDVPEVERVAIPVPGDARWLGAWVYTPDDWRNFSPFLHLRDPAGGYRSLPLRIPQTGDAEGWRFLTAAIPEIPGPSDWEILALAFGTDRTASFSGEIAWDEISSSKAAELPTDVGSSGFPDGEALETFDDSGRWSLFTDLSRQPTSDVVRSAGVAGRETVLRHTWTSSIRAGAPRGVRLDDSDTPLRMLATRDFLASAQLGVGEIATITIANVFVRVEFVGVLNLFPTWDPEAAKGLLIVDREALDYRINRSPAVGIPVRANELWLDVGSGEERGAVRTAIAESEIVANQVFDVETLRRQQDEDPLIAAGWRGMLFATFMVVVLISAVGFLTASILGAQQRASEFAVLRTMGFSARHVFVAVSLEHLLVILVAMAVGTAVGLQLGIQMLDFVGFTETGETLLPPFQTTTDWGTIAGAYGLLGLAFVVTIGLVVVLYLRLAIGQVLRIGVE